MNQKQLFQLAIGKVASDSFNISLSMFFRLMAIISINLGVINLFPIPVLDGGRNIGDVLGLSNAKLKDIIAHLKIIYCQLWQ